MEVLLIYFLYNVFNQLHLFCSFIILRNILICILLLTSVAYYVISPFLLERYERLKSGGWINRLLIFLCQKCTYTSTWYIALELAEQKY